MDKTIDFFIKQIEQLEPELADIASSEFDKQLKVLTSIKKIGITPARYGAAPYNRRVYLFK